jgi:RNA polymerase sigma-70 factor (ECF subfamily)
MNLIPLHKNRKKLFEKALENDRKAQRELFELYAPKMLSVCRMYVSDLHFAEDVMIRGFSKVFKNLRSFKHSGSFEGWIRQIMIHEAIDFLRTQKQLDFSSSPEDDFHLKTEPNFKILMTDHLQQLIDDLPEGYRVVFVMYVIEGYKHREIAEILDISEGTSKSQLAKARKKLQQKLDQERRSNEIKSS